MIGLRMARVGLGESQNKTARAVGVSQVYISRLERGVERASASMRRRLAAHFCVDAGLLFETTTPEILGILAERSR